jgi:hypothetical protein
MAKTLTDVDIKQYTMLIDHYVELLKDTESPEERSTYIAYIIEANSIVEHETGEPHIVLEGEDDPKIAFQHPLY